MLASAYHGALAVTVLASVALAGLIWQQSAAVTGARPLAGFVAVVAAWVAGLDLPWWAGPQATPVAVALIALGPLGGAAFLHFAATFGGRQRPGAVVLGYGVAFGYGVGVTGAVLGVAGGVGGFRPWPGAIEMFIPELGGWVAMTATVVLAIAGHGVLWVAWRRSTGLRRRQLAAVILSGLWGLASISGLAFPAFGLPWFPVTVLLLPGYTVFLVYGILRYRLMEVNLWARRALAWGLLTLAALAAAGALAILPAALVADTGWVTTALAVIVALTLDQPARRLADRIIYPGAHLAAQDMARWRSALGAARSRDDLARYAAAELGSRLGLPVTVSWSQAPGSHPTDGPGLLLRSDGVAWQCDATGWDEAPPGPRHVAHTFAAVLAEAATRLEQVLTLAAREREHQQRERLAELGALAATVAHDLRNPLNIIAMAVASGEPALRREVSEQIGRMDRLVRDLLDYAKPWRAAMQPLDLTAEVMGAASGLPGLRLDLDLPAGLVLHADPRRLRQVLVNLLHNARTATPDNPIGVIAETAPDGTVALHVCDRGPGIPPDIRDRLFQPFVSRSPDGTGLGLAIVAKVMTAHGGRAVLGDRPGWTTCITLHFPPFGDSPCDTAIS